MIQSMMQIKHLFLHFSLPATFKQSHGATVGVKVATQSDASMLQLLTTIQKGFPASKQDFFKDIQKHHQYRDTMYTIGDVILYKDDIVISLSLRESILNILHSAHQSVVSMLLQTMSTVFSPGIAVAVQAHGNLPQKCAFMTQCTTLPGPDTRIAFSLHLFRFFQPSRHSVPCHCGSIFQLVFNWKSLWLLERFN